MSDEIDDAMPFIERFNQMAIDAVVGRVNSGTPSTGVCSNCEETIEAERLKSLPYTRHCSECAAAFEEDRARQGKVRAHSV